MTNNPPTSRALHELDATELVAGYRRRDFSPVEVTRAVLGHVERWERHLQALYLLRPDRALEQARASESRWLRGEPLGPIDGVPLTIKENVATQGDPTPLGTAAVELTPAAADAPPAARPVYGGSIGTRPRLGLSVNTPHQLAGRRSEPPMSVPTCSGP